MPKILLVEDDVQMLHGLQRLLSSNNFEVVAVTSGLEAIEKAQENEFALIITDVRMPGMDGIEALGRIGVYQPQARKVIITGFAGDDAPIRAIQLSVDDYLMKPFGSEILLESVKNALARYQFEKAKADIVRNSASVIENVLQSVVASVEEILDQGAGRADRLMSLSARLAQAVDLSPNRMERLKKAAAFHDLGFIRRLNEKNAPEDQHARDAWKVLALIPGYEEIGQIVRHHHDGIDSEEKGFTLEANILGLAEDYDLMLAKKLSPSQAVISLRERARKYDPALLDALSRIVRTSPQTAPASPAEPAIKTYERLLHLAQAYSLIGEASMADAALLKIQNEPGALRNEDFKFRYHLVSAQNFIRQQKFMEGYKQAEGALEVALSFNLGPSSLAKAFLEMALAKLFLPDQQRLCELLEKAEQIFAKLKDRLGGARANLYLAFYHLTAGDRHKAEACLEQCRTFIKEDRIEEWLQTESAALRLPQGEHVYHYFAPHLSESRQELRICSLGPFRLYRGGSLVREEEWKSKKAKLILAYLLFNMDKPVSEERLCDTFWPETDFDRARKSLHHTIYLLRRTLEPSLQEGGHSRYILSQRDNYRFNKSAPHFWDVAEFRRHAQAAEQSFASGDEATGIQALMELERLYQGELLEDYSDLPWCLGEREKLRETCVKGLLRLAAHYDKIQQYSVALDLANRVLTHDPFHEQAATQQIRALYKSGQRSEAIRRYHDWCATLKQELNLAPPPELLSLYLEMTDSVVKSS